MTSIEYIHPNAELAPEFKDIIDTYISQYGEMQRLAFGDIRPVENSINLVAVCSCRSRIVVALALIAAGIQCELSALPKDVQGKLTYISAALSESRSKTASLKMVLASSELIDLEVSEDAKIAALKRLKNLNVLWETSNAPRW